MISLHSRWQNRKLPVPGKKELRKFAHAAAAAAGLPVDPAWDLNLLFVNDRSMARYNAELVGHEGTTDVITFSYFDSGEDYLPGDTMIELIINPDAAVREGARRPGGYSYEMALYIVHGLLHSAGEDDLSPAPRRRMRRREKECLEILEKEFDFNTLFPETK
ncbi:MAG: rRNA maturation RNase YbeY [Lentisphaerae bacterium]|nr:rRNA maturation RNase YbeY [Lentisphaerota bacterium]